MVLVVPLVVPLVPLAAPVVVPSLGLAADPGRQVRRVCGVPEALMLIRWFSNLLAPPVRQNLMMRSNISTIRIKAPEDANVLRCSEMKLRLTL